MQLDIKVRLVLNSFKARVRSGYFEVAQETEFKLAVQNKSYHAIHSNFDPATFYTVPDWFYSNYYYDTTIKFQKHTFIWWS